MKTRNSLPVSRMSQKEVSLTIRKGLSRALTAENCKFKVEAIAAQIEVNYHYLLNAANPTCDGTHHFALRKLPHFVEAVGNYIVLDVIEAMVGRVAIEIPSTPSDPDRLADHLLKITKELGDSVAAYQKAVDPRGRQGARISPAEKELMMKEAQDVLNAAGAALEAVRRIET